MYERAEYERAEYERGSSGADERAEYERGEYERAEEVFLVEAFLDFLDLLPSDFRGILIRLVKKNGSWREKCLNPFKCSSFLPVNNSPDLVGVPGMTPRVIGSIKVQRFYAPSFQTCPNRRGRSGT